MEQHIIKRLVLGCGVGTWSFVIGLLQTIESSLRLLFMINSYCGKDSSLFDEVFKQIQASSLQKGRALTEEEEVAVIIATHIVFVVVPGVVLLIKLLAGIYLIIGVIQQNVKKMAIWKEVERFILVIAFIGGLVCLGDEDYAGIVRFILEFFIVLFGIWVVKLRILELLNGQRNDDNDNDANNAKKNVDIEDNSQLKALPQTLTIFKS